MTTTQKAKPSGNPTTNARIIKINDDSEEREEDTQIVKTSSLVELEESQHRLRIVLYRLGMVDGQMLESWSDTLIYLGLITLITIYLVTNLLEWPAWLNLVWFAAWVIYLILIRKLHNKGRQKLLDSQKSNLEILHETQLSLIKNEEPKEDE